MTTAKSEIQKWTVQLVGFFCEYLKYKFFGKIIKYYYLAQTWAKMRLESKNSDARTIECGAHDKLW